jgi:hypothetical protein
MGVLENRGPDHLFELDIGFVIVKTGDFVLVL